jgi:hypothetical protein
MKPPFWPDYYWPWNMITDIHTKPKGMNEPLQYCQMMKLAIERGYQYFGYDPKEYIDPDLEERERECPSIATASINARWHIDMTSGVPPRLPRAASRLNCVQARTALSKLLRFQQMGNNPVYGSPETRPPWWPEESIRWEDMVDLRGKPPYLPDQKSYTDVLRLAIEKAIQYYGFDPETYVEQIDASGPAITIIRPLPELIDMDNKDGILAKVEGDDVDEELEYNEEIFDESNVDSGLPQLPKPIDRLNCGEIRVALSKLLWFHNGNMPPNYGFRDSMPSWWPSNLMDWTKLKNLRHRYEGPLGSTYTNCLRSALIRGYAYYGSQADEQTEVTVTEEPEVVGRLLKSVGKSKGVTNGETDIVSSVVAEPKSKRPPPALVPIGFTTSEEGVRSGYAQQLLDSPNWFPPSLSDPNVLVSSQVLDSLKQCKVTLNRQEAKRDHRSMAMWLRSVSPDDVTADAEIVTADGRRFSVHKPLLAAHSSVMKSVLLESEAEDRATLLFPDIAGDVMQVLVSALYTGEAIVDGLGCSSTDFSQGLRTFQQLGLLKRLIPRVRASSRDQVQIVSLSSRNDPANPIKNKRPATTLSSPPTSKKVRKAPATNSEDVSGLDVITEGSLEQSVKKGVPCLIDLLVRSGSLSPPPACAQCGEACVLRSDADAVDRYSYSCPARRGKGGGGHAAKKDVRHGSVWEGRTEDLAWLARMLLCWKSNTSISQCQQKTDSSPEEIYQFYELCTKHFQ